MRILIGLMAAWAGFFSGGAMSAEVPLWKRFEGQVTHAAAPKDPFRDTGLRVKWLRPDGSSFESQGFYDGGQVWRFRCLPDQVGSWKYSASFANGASAAQGAFECVPSAHPGLIGLLKTNPIWFGYPAGQPFLMRSFHCGDRFFATNWDDPGDPGDGNPRSRFLDWAQAQGYNTLSIASHYLNRSTSGRGLGWHTPKLWPLDPREFQTMEKVLDDLESRNLVVFPFAGFFGRDSNFPTAWEDQQLFLRYVIARLGSYPNLLWNVAGPEPLLRGKSFLSYTQLDRLAREIQSLDPYGHLISVHNATGDDAFRGEPWFGFGTLQGPKTVNRRLLAEGLLRNHHPARPLYAQETLWPGNQLGHPAYSDDDIRKNALVMLFSAAMINFGDMDGTSSSGFSASLDPAQAVTTRHHLIRQVWDLFETLPWAGMKPRPDLVNTGFCLAQPGRGYLVYLDEPAPVQVKTEGGPFEGEWINPRVPGQRVAAAQTSGEAPLRPPAEGDWILHLKPAAAAPEVDGVVRLEAEDGQGNWTRVEGLSGRAVQDPGSGAMRYPIHFRQPGKYYVFLLARQGPLGKDKQNDVLLSLDGQKLYGSDHATRPDGMRSYGDWKWTRLPKGPGPHTPDNIRNDGVYFLVDQPGIRVLEVAHRSESFSVDRILLKRDDPDLPAPIVREPFDPEPSRPLPVGWVPVLAGEGRPQWLLVQDPSAPSTPWVLKQAGWSPNPSFPMCIRIHTLLRDGFVQTHFKALSGTNDQAAGLVWRYADPANYYIARANALEGNVVLYKVQNGKRTALDILGRQGGYGVPAPVPAREWHALRVDFAGHRFRVSLNGKELFTVEDATFTRPGAVGLWTKADSVMLFDSFGCGE